MSTRRQPTKGRGAGVGSGMKGLSLYLAKRGSGGTNSCLVATKTNLIPSNSLTHEKEV